MGRPGLVLLLFLLTIACGKQEKAPAAEAVVKPLSTLMAESVMARNPEPWMIDFQKKPRWEYTQGLVLKSVLAVWQHTGDQTFFDYVKTYYDQFVREDGSIWLYERDIYNIDRINPGKPLFLLYKETEDEKFKKALFTLREQMKTHPRTNEGGFWHKKRYPYQMWLDGLYMAGPFLAEFAVTFDEPELLDEVANQFVWMESHARDPQSGLLYHAWDESRQQRWADPETGLSPHFWGRAMGWYAMALVDVLDFFPADHPRRGEIVAIYQRLAQALSKYQEKETGVWYQVVDLPEREGNYRESSATCMYTYAYLKALRKGYLDSQYMAVAQKAYQGILKQFVEKDDRGLLNITRACAVAGLGGDPYRDGSFAYYIGEPIRTNDTKAVGPFILASLEYESLK
ncbi:MAG TPA: glycoside hydrolase family 88 protein [Calditrichia bacterium]|nr:glycoside hydrolase family 88 protein [Calditrichia bacterium]